MSEEGILAEVYTWLEQWGVDGLWADWVAVLVILLLSAVAFFVARRIVVTLIRFLISRTRSDVDNALEQHQVFAPLVYLVPVWVIYRLLPVVLGEEVGLSGPFQGGLAIAMILISLVAIDRLLSAGLDIYRGMASGRQITITSFVQAVKVVVYCIGFIFILSILFGKTPLYLLSGLSAMTAVLLLIFRDAILGFVAGIQLTAHRMVARGDWIEMPKYNADGDVTEISLTTVKVQNWDKTVTTIPTYALISESFKNWRGMADSGGRRIKRSVVIDMNTICFCDEEMLERFAKIRYISDYISTKKQELAEFNQARQVDNQDLINSRRLTNVGTFRAYVKAYLANHPQIHSEMTFLVRHLAPNQYGLPIEIYVFSRDQVWANYEGIQADIFDHILAIVPEFDLRVFQNPAGSDFNRLIEGV